MSYHIETQCRSCKNQLLTEIISFGNTPVADRLLSKNDANNSLLFPLTLVFCETCALVQLKETVAPELLYCKNYPYFSSVSNKLNAHFQDSANKLINLLNLNANSLVIEAASNDGYMLQHFQQQGIKVLGIDPSQEAAQRAIAKGIPTRNTFFSLTLAQEIRREFPNGVDLVLANNVLAHVADLNGFIQGIQHLLNDSGVAVIEVPYLINLLEHCEFDTIYHQHLCYFSATSLKPLFEQNGLFLNKIEQIDIHGGSLRLFIEKKQRMDISLLTLIKNEQARGVALLSFYQDFPKKIDSLRHEVNLTLKKIKAQGYTIAAYGAAAKATTFMSYFEIDNKTLDFIVDKNSYKHGKFMGGNHIPILSPDAIYTQKPDYILILAWNFADEIMTEHQQYKQAGGHFIIPIPKLEIL